MVGSVRNPLPQNCRDGVKNNKFLIDAYGKDYEKAQPQHYLLQTLNSRSLKFSTVSIKMWLVRFPQ